MTLRVFNNLTGQSENFVPQVPGKAGMYVCGVTVYDDAHLGHARGALAFEIIRRYLRFRGYDVTYVRNFTDVDDKIIVRAQEEGVGAADIAERYIQAFTKDMERLGVAAPDFEPRATEHIPSMVEMIQGLIDKGYAYETDGDVYFAVREFGEYGRLSGKNLDELESGARVEVNEQKRDPLDFTLWKAAKPGEPSWESPWGEGRPGWHIECSAMSLKHLGKTFDIHGGGTDLIFPHHENERAQSCAFSGEGFARYWLHNGMVRIHQEKMSKSTGNFFSVRATLEKFHPEVIRFLLAGSHYRSALEYSDDAAAAAGRGLDRLYNACLRAEEACVKAPEGADGGDPILDQAVRSFEVEFTEAMDDDFNTPRAIGGMFTLARQIHNAIDRLDPSAWDAKSGAKIPAETMKRAVDALTRRAQVLTFLNHSPMDWFRLASITASTDKAEGMLDDETIERMILERVDARTRKDWAEADRIRDELKAGNVLLEDGPTGTQWKRVQT